MGSKKGTMLGRAVLPFLKEGSVIHNIAEAADSTFDDLLFDDGDEQGTPVRELPEVKQAAVSIKDVLLGAAKLGIVALNFPYVEGEEEAQAEQGAYLLLEAYVNEATD